ncbi:MFS transporter [Novosphingobium sp.]|uniref:MFS transporter n=1 Tax=Novosphingobium sp. TaxID=1874826 RepID=UPI0028B1E53F|nr:MFS transporter [Novosphingobium sp.]
MSASVAKVPDHAHSPTTRFRWIVLSVIFVVYMLAAADRANIGIVLPHVQDEFGISNSQAGIIVSLFFLFYSLGQVPAGLLIGKIGVRVSAPLAIALTSASTLLIGTAGSLGLIKFYRGLLGVAEAALPLSMLATINRWFPAKEKGTATGAFLAAAKLGAVIAPPLGALIIAKSDWRMVFIIFAIPGVFLALTWWLLVPNDPRSSRFVSESEADYIEEASVAGNRSASGDRGDFGTVDRLLRYRPIDEIHGTKSVFKSWNIWGCGLGYLLMTGVVNVLLAWLPKYLTEVRHLALMEVGFIASLPFVGGVAGNLVGGWFSDRVLGKRRKPTMMISAIATCVMMAFLVFMPDSIVLVSLLLFSAGFLLNLGYSAYTVYPMGFTSKPTYPVAASLVNTAGQAGGALAPLVTGMLLDLYDWNAVFLFLSACSMTALLLLATIVEPADHPARG